MLGNHDFFGPTFLAWMEKAALFAMLAASINLSRGLLGAKHYYLQGILIITHSILGLIFLQYVDVFKEALLTVPAIQGLEAEIIQDIILGLDIVTVIVFISVIISFIVSLVQAFRFKGKYKKYKKKMKIWNQQY